MFSWIFLCAISSVLDMVRVIKLCKRNRIWWIRFWKLQNQLMGNSYDHCCVWSVITGNLFRIWWLYRYRLQTWLRRINRISWSGVKLKVEPSSLLRVILWTHQCRCCLILTEFIFQTDAYNDGIGAFLLHEQSGIKHPVAFASTKLLPILCLKKFPPLNWCNFVKL